MSVNLNLFISEKHNEMLDNFKKKYGFKNKSMALEKIIEAGVKSYKE